MKNFFSHTFLLMFIFHLTACAQNNNIELPKPQTSGGMPLMEALSNRSTSRDFSPKELDLQTLSNLLWAANGINRPEEGKKTAPSAVNWQEIEIFVSLSHGVYLYNAQKNCLELHLKGDHRKATGMQDYVEKAPVNLIYVGDFSRMADRGAEQMHWYTAADAAFIAQNVYLFCASEDMATVVRGAVNRDVLKQTLALPEHKHIVLCQTVGYKK